jgi:two-component system heavy metal sensor histidine kinase CusS
VKVPGTRENGAPELILLLARDVAPVQATLASLRAILLSSGLLASAVSILLIWMVIRRSLGPLNQLAVEISRLDTSNLAARVSAGRSVHELSPVTARLNDLLGRMQAALDRERAFSADVAHELRTPLSGLLSIQDVTLSRLRPAEEYREALEESRQITTQMQQMVENLLVMSRLEAGQVGTRLESLVPNEVLQAVWRSMHQAAEARGLGVQWDLAPDTRVSTDPSLLQLVVRNILENAIAYAEAGGQVKVGTRYAEARWEVSVSNTGSQLSQEQAEQAFGRFWRGDAARSAAGGHCGLGLALVAKAVGFLGGSVKIKSSVGREFEITVAFPAHA